MCASFRCERPNTLCGENRHQPTLSFFVGAFADTFCFYGLSLPSFVKQYSNSVFLIEASAHEDVTTFRLPYLFCWSPWFRPRELRLTCILRSPWRVRRICRRCVTISHSLVWCHRTSSNIFLYSSPLSCCWSFLLPFRGRGWVRDCRILVACLACALVSECSMGSHRGCSNRFRVLLLKLSHVEDHSLSCHRLVCQSLVTAQSLAYQLFDVRWSIFSIICSRVVS